MIRIVLLLLGCVLLLLEQCIIHVDTNTQFIIFLTGILLMGVPHGSADLLVASRNARAGEKEFSKTRFLAIYIGRLLLFAAILWIFPVAGILLFLLFAAYHFGETDLHQFKTNTLSGKLFVVSYGLVIICVILMHHFEEAIPFFQLFEAGKENETLINRVEVNRYLILSAAGIFFFASCFIYFLLNGSSTGNEKGQFLIRFAVIVVILFKLPLLLGFTFYFVVWHSVLSLNNIVSFLRSNNAFSWRTIARQIVLYSMLAISGIGLFGLTGSMFISSNAVAGYLFIGLAVLTAPHMTIMHDMYNTIRLKRS